jgi:hypothetical protein
MRETGTLTADLKRILNTYSEAQLERVMTEEGFQRWYKKEQGLKRSDLQNRYYYGVVVKMLCDLTGFTKDEMNYQLEVQFVGLEPVLDREERQLFYANGQPMMFVPEKKRPKNMSRAEFTIFIDRIREWALDFHNLEIPLPFRRDDIYNGYR